MIYDCQMKANHQGEEMKYKQLGAGDVLEVGDVIIFRHSLGDRKYIVCRVSKNIAFVRWNEVAEGKFKRRLDWSKPTPIPRADYDYMGREAYRPIKAVK
jgi:hypothetical protein